jgi:aerobic carbon-monoxide dehydrogenase medium subunit
MKRLRPNCGCSKEAGSGLQQELSIRTTAGAPARCSRPGPATRFRYRKIRHPASGYAVVGVAVAVALSLQDDIVSEAAIAVTGATGRAFAAETASARLIGKSLSSENIASAALLASEQAQCLSDHYAPADYRKHLIRTEVGRALASLSAA